MSLARKIFSCLALVAVAAVSFQPAVQEIARAEGAALSFSPESGTFAVGRTFTVKVALNSGGGVGVNAADGTVSFESAYLSVSGVSKEGSVFTLWTSDPSFSNSNGTITFSGGSPSPYTRSGGTVVTITFRVLKAGATTLSFSSASVLAADGQGTNVLSETRKANYTLTASAPAPAAPAPEPEATPAVSEPAGSFGLAIDITSPTHPDPEKWYANKNPEFKWKLPPDVSGVSAILNNNPAGVPPKISEGLIEDKKFENVQDGIWYLHTILKSQSGAWSQATHRKVLVDMTPPEAFEIELQQAERGATPKLGIRTTDQTSGIDRYEIKVNDKDAVSVPTDQLRDGAYELSPLLPGKHKVSVRAVDKAGNGYESVKEFEIDGLAMPQIRTSPGILEEREFLIVEGVADRGAKIIVKLESEGKVISEEAVRSDEDGNWIYAYRKHLKRGAYDISAKMVTKYGAESGFTEKVPLTVFAPPFVERYGLFLILLLIFGAAALGFLLYEERRQAARHKEMVRRETEEIRHKTEAIFSALEEETEEKMELLDEAIAEKLGAEKLTPDQVLEKLKDALDISHDTLAKEIEDVEKALEE